jgi:hypothetical protein
MSETEPKNTRHAFRVEPLEDRIVFANANLMQATSGHGDLQLASSSSSYDYNHEIDIIHDKYGLGGLGQTVAIIDSGIAYDHYALGGGLGAGYRVVGGWDFAENDANPYDDGPAGFHGTHVAGIVGSDDATYTGVASQVDLVALRVFDDFGSGTFGWVEQALQWVHHNRFDFENPITTVNMSVGSDWNSDHVPNWATLEDELVQLHDDGIFVSVAAGNSFRSFQAKGLSYPAVSSSVVPVASVGSDGLLSDFSQRDDRVLAAPGERITSTGTDYLYDFNGITDDFISVSGTSMAAPYVAGASALVREAMQLMGQTEIDQDDIFEVFRRTADLVYDSATGQSYHRINVEAALEAVIGPDDYGASRATAHNVGVVTSTSVTSGVINQLDDADRLTFVAGNTGTLTLGMDWHGGASQAPQLSASGFIGDAGSLTLNVVAGRSYDVIVSGETGIGQYDVIWNMQSSQSSPTFHAPGAVIGETLFEWMATETGQMSVTTTLATSISGISIELHDADGNRLYANADPDMEEVFAIAAIKGKSYVLKIQGANTFAHVQVHNANHIDTFHGEGQRGTTGPDTPQAIFSASDHLEFGITTVATDVVGTPGSHESQEGRLLPNPAATEQAIDESWQTEASEFTMLAIPNSYDELIGHESSIGHGGEDGQQEPVMDSVFAEHNAEESGDDGAASWL